MSDNNTNKTMLMEMGFDDQRATEALTVCDGNVERAIEYLFAPPSSDPPVFGTGRADTGVSATTAFHTGRDITASISQYSVDQGRSACTCIALTAAQQFLQQQQQQTTVTPAFLEGTIQQGVQTYQTLQSQSATVEHMSAEEVLALSSSSAAPPFSNLELIPGGIRQGILGGDSSMGLESLLRACRQDAPDSHQWLAVLITKTPETVLAILPPPSSSSSASTSSPEYMVIDSHPRPGVVNSNGGAYARIVPTLQDVVGHLATILPATELGADIPEMMAMMYNSFDLYPLVLKK